MAPTVKDLLAESQLVFTGTVEKANASTVADLTVDDRTVVVRVGEVLHAPPGVDVALGSTITVQLADDLWTLGPGETATFFANGLAYGEELAVAEVGRTRPRDAAEPTARLGGLEAGQGGLWPLPRTTVPELTGQAPHELLDALDLQDSILLDVLREHAI